jgi:hypothetical protein
MKVIHRTSTRKGLREGIKKSNDRKKYEDKHWNHQ